MAKYIKKARKKSTGNAKTGILKFNVFAGYKYLYFPHKK